MGRAAIVLGGAGFVGSHLLQLLAASGEYTQLVSGDIGVPRFRSRVSNTGMWMYASPCRTISAPV